MERDINSEISVLKQQMTNVEDKIDSLAKDMDKNFNEMKKEMRHYIRREEFAPVKAITYGFVGIILTTVIIGLLALVLK